MKRGYTLVCNCTEPGCHEKAVYRFDTRKGYSEAYALKYRSEYKCVRHSMGNGVLTPTNQKTEWISEPLRQEDYGRFFGGHGLIVGHGYYALANDFPVGTTIRITCEAILPEPVINQ